MGWSSLSQERLSQDLRIICGFLLPALFCFLIPLESGSADFGYMLWSFLHTFDDAVRISKSHSVFQDPLEKAMLLSSGRNGCWLWRGSDSGNSLCCAFLSQQLPPAATSVGSHWYSLLPTPSLDCLQPYLESQRRLRWDEAISRKCSGISFLEKKKRALAWVAE